MKIPDDLSIKAEMDAIFNRIDHIIKTITPYQHIEGPSDTGEKTEKQAETGRHE